MIKHYYYINSTVIHIHVINGTVCLSNRPGHAGQAGLAAKVFEGQLPGGQGRRQPIHLRRDGDGFATPRHGHALLSTDSVPRGALLTAAVCVYFRSRRDGRFRGCDRRRAQSQRDVRHATALHDYAYNAALCEPRLRLLRTGTTIACCWFRPTTAASRRTAGTIGRTVDTRPPCGRAA